GTFGVTVGHAQLHPAHGQPPLPVRHRQVLVAKVRLDALRQQPPARQVRLDRIGVVGDGGEHRASIMRCRGWSRQSGPMPACGTACALAGAAEAASFCLVPGRGRNRGFRRSCKEPGLSSPLPAAGVGLGTMKTTSAAVIAACALLAACQEAPQPETTTDAAGNTLVEWPLPAGAGAAQPDMSLAPDGRLLLSWIKPYDKTRHELQYTTFDSAGQ